jgi:hypothetical protein
VKVKLKRLNNSLTTDLQLLLEQIPENILFHNEHSLRHPIGIFNVSSSRVMKAFQDILEAKDKLVDFDYERDNYNQSLKETEGLLNQDISQEEQTKLDHKIASLKDELKQLSIKQSEQDNQFLNKVKELLDSLMSFIDDTYHIMKTLFPASEVINPIIFADKWMVKADKKLVTGYKDRLKDYRDFLATIVNKIMHNHGRLNFIKFITVHGEIVGYYIEGLDNNGALGTDRTIHKRFRNEDTAFSLNRDLKFHLTNFFFICHYLKVILQRILERRYNLQIPNLIMTKDGSEDFLDVCMNIQDLPNLFFPDEIYKPVPEINIFDEYVEFTYPANSSILLVYGEIKISSNFSGDGVTKSFRLPYWTPR